MTRKSRIAQDADDISRKAGILKQLAEFLDDDEWQECRKYLLSDDEPDAMDEDDSIENPRAMDRYTTASDLDAMSANMPPRGYETNMGARGGEMSPRGSRGSTAMDSFRSLFPDAQLPKVDSYGLAPDARPARRPLSGIEARPRMANDAHSSAAVASFHEMFPDAARIRKL